MLQLENLRHGFWRVRPGATAAAPVRRCRRRSRLLDHRDRPHTTVTACFATVVVQSRLLSFDVSLEEAAMDLGCRR